MKQKSKVLNVTTPADCKAVVQELSGPYPITAGWQQALEIVLPTLPEILVIEGRRYTWCVGFSVDDEIGAHYLFDEGPGLEEILLEEITFKESFSLKALIWLQALREWQKNAGIPKRRPRNLRGR